jgi:glutamine amidotransferase
VCRHLAAVSDVPFPLAPLLFGQPHALASQARNPRHQTSGTTNPDGWGVAWYPPGADVPEQYRTVTPIWEDEEFARRSEGIECTAVLAAARLASPGAAIDVSGNAPFVAGPWAFSLNGIVDGFRDGVGDALRARISERRRAALTGDSDTEVLFASVLDRLEAGNAPDRALAAAANEVLSMTTGRLNLLLTDGHAVYGTRYGNSLFRRGSLLASEPLDSQTAWREMRDDSLISRDANGGWARSPLKGRS